MHVHDKLFIDGGWVPPSGQGSFEVTNASTEESIGRVPAGNAEDASRAVAAAARAFSSWSTRSTEDRLKDRALRVARRMRTGQVDINGGVFNLAAPFGGFKQSGIGREGGRHGLEEFLEIKSIQR
jgi:acyl-CoA reductase-like NAD-dependent aldehyde dehydrogenase